jgi:diguanylate cyclase (GGDEF)-like protein
MGMSTRPPEEIHPWHHDVQEALDKVREVIEDVVRREQHRNDLTNLPNERALDSKLEQAFADEHGKDIWCAFVEIDNFKRLNEVYKYEAGNAMLKKVAEQLKISAESYFGGLGLVQAFHAHGDEFYMIGERSNGVTADKIHSKLDAIRNTISSVSVHVGGFDEPMTATVTIGWAFKSDLEDANASRLGFRRCVEDAVGFGKRKGRNRTVQYNADMRKSDIYSERGNCTNPKCEAAFTVDVEKNKSENQFLWCPNCGTKQDRPKRPVGTLAEAEA